MIGRSDEPGGGPLAPPWTIDLPLPADLVVLPARRGVCAIEDAAGRTLALFGSADVRRLARARLAKLASDAARVRALTVASRFEQDWAWLAAARRRLPAAYAETAARLRAWFVHCDPAAGHPRFSRVARPAAGSGAAPRSGVSIGPIETPGAAARYVEMLEDAFDLCRYHDVLVQAPHGVACAYKQMGRCPAPCDGSVSMEAYRGQIDAALAFGADPEDLLARVRGEMDAAAERLDFETAERRRRRLAVLERATRPEYAACRRLDRFRFLVVHGGERAGTARLTVVLGGRVAPWADVGDVERDRVAATLLPALAPLADAAVHLGGDDDVTLALACRALLRGEGAWLPLDRLDADRLADAIVSARA